MKVVMRAILVVAIVLLGFLCWRSIQGPIDFQKEVVKRERAIIQRLVDIRTAQVAYRELNGSYTASFDTLGNFIKNGMVATVRRVGDLNEQQLESGMTETKAMNIIKSGNEKTIRAAGLWDDVNNRPQIQRDSIFAPAMEILFPNRTDLNPDQIGIVPFTNNAKFEMAKSSLETNSGYPIEVFEAKVAYAVYLEDLDKKLVSQKIQEMVDRPSINNYPGLKVGSLTVANNNSGNWE